MPFKGNITLIARWLQVSANSLSSLRIYPDSHWLETDCELFPNVTINPDPSADLNDALHILESNCAALRHLEIANGGHSSTARLQQQLLRGTSGRLHGLAASGALRQAIEDHCSGLRSLYLRDRPNNLAGVLGVVGPTLTTIRTGKGWRLTEHELEDVKTHC